MGASASCPRRADASELAEVRRQLEVMIRKVSSLQLANEGMRSRVRFGGEDEAAVPGSQCVVCMDAEAGHAFLPCMHVCACQACALRLCERSVLCQEALRCPICRRECSDVRPVYVSTSEDAEQVAAATAKRGAQTAKRSIRDARDTLLTATWS